jgi:hypothetical protein
MVLMYRLFSQKKLVSFTFNIHKTFYFLTQKINQQYLSICTQFKTQIQIFFIFIENMKITVILKNNLN